MTGALLISPPLSICFTTDRWMQDHVATPPRFLKYPNLRRAAAFVVLTHRALAREASSAPGPTRLALLTVHLKSGGGTETKVGPVPCAPPCYPAALLPCRAGLLAAHLDACNLSLECTCKTAKHVTSSFAFCRDGPGRPKVPYR